MSEVIDRRIEKLGTNNEKAEFRRMAETHFVEGNRGTAKRIASAVVGVYYANASDDAATYDRASAILDGAIKDYVTPKLGLFAYCWVPVGFDGGASSQTVLDLVLDCVRTELSNYLGSSELSGRDIAKIVNRAIAQVKGK